MLPSYVNSSTGCLKGNGSTTNWRSSHTERDQAHLHHPIQDYLPARTLRSSDKLLITVPRMALVKAFCVSTASVLNSLQTYNCKSAELLSTFKHYLKTELFDSAYCKRKHLAYKSSPPCASDSFATHGAIQMCFD